MSSEKEALLMQLRRLNEFCFECDAVGYGHYDPCAGCEFRKLRKCVLEKIYGGENNEKENNV